MQDQLYLSITCWKPFYNVLIFLRDPKSSYWHDSITAADSSSAMLSWYHWLHWKVCDCKGHLSAVGLLSWSRSQFKIIWYFWFGVIPLEVAIGRWVHCRDRCGQQQYSSSLRHSSNALLVVRGPKCANKISQQMISFWNTQTTQSDTKNHAVFKIIWTIFLFPILGMSAGCPNHVYLPKFTDLLKCYQPIWRTR